MAPRGAQSRQASASTLATAGQPGGVQEQRDSISLREAGPTPHLCDELSLQQQGGAGMGDQLLAHSSTHCPDKDSQLSPCRLHQGQDRGHPSLRSVLPEAFPSLTLLAEILPALAQSLARVRARQGSLNDCFCGSTQKGPPGWAFREGTGKERTLRACRRCYSARGNLAFPALA